MCLGVRPRSAGNFRTERGPVPHGELFRDPKVGPGRLPRHSGQSDPTTKRVAHEGLDSRKVSPRILPLRGRRLTSPGYSGTSWGPKFPLMLISTVERPTGICSKNWTHSGSKGFRLVLPSPGVIVSSIPTHSSPPTEVGRGTGYYWTGSGREVRRVLCGIYSVGGPTAVETLEPEDRGRDWCWVLTPLPCPTPELMSSRRTSTLQGSRNCLRVSATVLVPPSWGETQCLTSIQPLQWVHCRVRVPRCGHVGVVGGLEGSRHRSWVKTGQPVGRRKEEEGSRIEVTEVWSRVV